MSLDVYLEIEVDTGGHEPHVVQMYGANITHNLGSMAREGGFYEAVWRPEECGIETAGQLIPILEKAVVDMLSEPKRFMRHNPPNGWGSYQDFVPWLNEYLAACRQHPKAKVRAWR